MFERLKRAARRFGEADHDRRAESIKDWATHQAECTLIREVAPRSRARVAGAVERLRVRPRQGGQAFEADIVDGTGTVTAVWTGRRTIPGMVIGARVVIEGRFGGEGHLQVLNPTYEFTSSEH